MKEQYIERYQRLFGIATIDRIEDMTISVYTDHLPKHFHVIKKDQFEVRLDSDTLKIISYKWQIDNKEMSSKDIKKIQQWIKSMMDQEYEVLDIEVGPLRTKNKKIYPTSKLLNLLGIL